jgi:hypothetical protein
MSPFQTVLKKYLDAFSDQEMYFVNDIRNLDFFKENPENSSIESIRMKLSALHDNDLAVNYVTEEMIDHILKLQIDSRLQKNDLTVVEDIARLNARGKTFNLLHFASVYCNFHRPDVYPIYSEQFHDFYKQYIKENNLPLDPEKITTYDVFSKALNDLAVRLELKGEMNYLHLRKFAWLYAEPIIKESSLN